MGLDNDFLQMLSAVVLLERWLGNDEFGNDVYDAPTLERAYISTTTRRKGDDEGAKTTANPSATASLTMDSLGIKPGDRLHYDGKNHWVVQEDTEKDEFGNDLYQTVQVTTTKRG